jgi:2-haloalkanoic acid dehalogenase type II
VRWHESVNFTLREIFAEKHGSGGVNSFIKTFHHARHALTEGDFKRYTEILAGALRCALASQSLIGTSDDVEKLLNAVQTCPPFPETKSSLEELRENYKIVIISNSDIFLITENIAAIGVIFDHVIVSEKCAAYKPSPVIFKYMLQTIGAVPADVLHVGASVTTDIAPATALGIRSVLVARDCQSVGLNFHQSIVPDLSFIPKILRSEML